MSSSRAQRRGQVLHPQIHHAELSAHRRKGVGGGEDMEALPAVLSKRMAVVLTCDPAWEIVTAGWWCAGAPYTGRLRADATVQDKGHRRLERVNALRTGLPGLQRRQRRAQASDTDGRGTVQEPEITCGRAHSYWISAISWSCCIFCALMAREQGSP